MRPNKSLLSLLAGVLLALNGVAQGEVSLRIVDANGAGIPGVALVSTSGHGAVTDGLGTVVLSDSVLYMEATWMLRCLGFQDREMRSEELISGRAFRMEEAVLDLPQALVEAVSLTGGRPMGVPGAVTVLSAKALRRQGATDINRALRTVPGVYIQEEDGFGLRPNIGLRGSGAERSSRISILEDGVPIAPAPYTAPSAYYFPSVGRMAGVEVMKGASQIAHGPNTIGGAINFISTPIPSALAGRVDGRIGSFGTGRLHVYTGDGSGRIGWMVEAMQAGSRGFKSIDGGGPTGFDKLDLLGKLRWTSREGARLVQRVEAKLGAVNEVSHETYAGLLRADFETDPYRRYAGSAEDRMEAHQRQAVLTHVVELGRGWRWTNRAYATRFDRNWYKADRAAAAGGEWVKLGTLLGEGVPMGDRAAALGVFRDGAPGVVRLKNNNRIYHARGLETKASWEHAGTGWQRWDMALRLHADGMDRLQWTDDWQMTSGRLTAPAWGTPGEESNRIEWTRALSGYAQGRWSRSGWSCLPGLRVESILAGRDDYGTADVDRTGSNIVRRKNRTLVVLPGIGVQRVLGSEWSVFAGVHRGFLPPGSSDEVAPEFAWNSEAGMRWVRARAEATVVGFGHFGRNLQGSDFAASGGSGDGEVFNGGSTRVLGVEAAANLTNGIQPTEGHRFELGLAYTFTDGRFTTSFTSEFEPWGEVQAGDFLPYMARHQGTLRLGWARGAWSLDASGAFVDPMRVAAGNAPLTAVSTAGGSTVLDATVRCRLRNGFSLEASCRNLFDAVYVASNRPAGLRPGMPRTITGGFNLSF